MTGSSDLKFCSSGEKLPEISEVERILEKMSAAYGCAGQIANLLQKSLDLNPVANHEIKQSHLQFQA